VGLATHLPLRAVQGEHTETFEFFLRELSDLCGKRSFSPFFWTLPTKNHIAKTARPRYNVNPSGG